MQFVTHVQYETLVKFMTRRINVTRMIHETHMKYVKHMKYDQKGTFSKSLKFKEFYNNLAGSSRSWFKCYTFKTLEVLPGHNE